MKSLRENGTQTLIKDLESIGFQPAKKKRLKPADEIEDGDIEEHQARESWSGRFV